MKLITTLIVLCTLTTFASADDWPNFRGANHNGNSSESTWNSRLGGAPKVAWRASVGEGYSSVAVAGGKVFTVGNSNGTDTVWGLDAATGRMVWRYSYRCDAGDYGGPRATPAVDGDRVYTFSRDGRAFCINANTGKLVWQANVAGIAKAEMPNWGFAGSPLVEGANVYYNAGDSGVALDKMTGKVFWRSGGGKGGYSTPVPFTQGGTRGIALFTSYGVAAVTASQGKVLWYFPWETNYGVNSADPLFYNNNVFISSNYGKGCALLRLGNGQLTPVYQNRNMKNHFNACVLVGDYVYGNDEGKLQCLDARSGAVKWSTRGIGKGGLIAANGKLIILNDNGELAIAEADPNRYVELSRAKVLEGECWTQPALANGMIFCRSHEGNLVCLDVRKR